jgi:hypothetical protein
MNPFVCVIFLWEAKFIVTKNNEIESLAII